MAGRVEGRIVSVLFCDLVGFTSLSEALDAEDVAIVQDESFAAVKDAVGRARSAVVAREDARAARRARRRQRR